MNKYIYIVQPLFIINLIKQEAVITYQYYTNFNNEYSNYIL